MPKTNPHEGKKIKGGVKHVMYQPHWHWSHNNMVATHHKRNKVDLQ